MSFITSLAAVGTAVAGTAGVAGLSTGTAALLGAGTLTAGGAALGAGTSAAMGGDPGKGALMGGIAAPLLVPSAMGAAGALGAGAAGGGAATTTGGLVTTAAPEITGTSVFTPLSAEITGGTAASVPDAVVSGLAPTTTASGVAGATPSTLGWSQQAIQGLGMDPASTSGKIASEALKQGVYGAGIGALGSGVTGKDPLKGAAMGLGTGALGGAGAGALGSMAGTGGTTAEAIGNFAAKNPGITGAGIGLAANMGINAMNSGPSAEDNLNAANASDREQYLRYLRAYRPSLSPGYAAGGITDLDGYMSNAQNIPNSANLGMAKNPAGSQNIPNTNEVADPEGYGQDSTQSYAAGGLSSLIPGGQDGADWLAKNSLPGMIFGWEGAHDIPLIGGMFNDPNTASLSPEEKKKLLEMAAAQGQPVPAQAMASGGIADLGGYRSGESPNLLHGPGTGVSDDIPATIEGKRPARLASGEYVISSRIVSELGQGSTDAGAKVLDNMVNRINEGRSKTLGGKNYAKDTKAYKHLPA